MMKRLAIIQSAYIPWRGLFDLIGRCDEYVIYDSVQFSKGHWHNRNRIRTPNGSIWLTIPVATSSRLDQAIEDVEVAKPWAERHWESIRQSYRAAPFFRSEAPAIQGLFEAAAPLRKLTDINELFLRGLSERLGLQVRIKRDSDYVSSGRKTERLIDLCLAAEATHYLSGPSARNYLDQAAFAEAGISLEWMSYGPYPNYGQMAEDFDPSVSILDTILCCGPEAPRVIHPKDWAEA